MSGTVCPPDLLAGVLPAVITGGRPSLRRRPTSKFLGQLVGLADPVWVVRDDDRPAYEDDGHEFAVYPRDWADEWAKAHWTGIDPWEPGAYLGAFPGREWACRLAAERGCWGVLQLDDNLIKLSLWSGHGASKAVAMANGGLGLFADMIAAVAQSTNAAMCGAAMAAVNPQKELTQSGGKRRVLARPGFPYSLFLERVDRPGREPYIGPFEDDILHGYAYGSSADPVTAALVLPLRYGKETVRQDGMRLAYRGHKRAVGLQRVAPEMAKLNVRASTANGRGGPRVFHTMRNDAIRTPLVVTDRDLWAAAVAKAEDLAAQLPAAYREFTLAKVTKRAARAGRG